MRRRPGLEFLEKRALMANIMASGVISSVAAGSNFDYTIQLTNSSASSSGIGTFWYALGPTSKDLLATRPVSVTPPVGWSGAILYGPPGYSIEFLASSSAYDVEPGSSLNFKFESGDTPASVNGNSVNEPGTPVGSSFLYPGTPIGDGGSELVVTPGSTPTPTPTPTPTSTPLVSVTDVQMVRSRTNMVTEIIVGFSGALNASDADRVATYRLVTAGNKGSFTAKNATVLKLKSAVYANDAVMLTSKKAFALAKPVELVVNGQSLEDGAGQLIDGANDGQPGSNYVAILRGTAVTPTPTPAPTPIPLPGH
jgi:hypothetical protein